MRIKKAFASSEDSEYVAKNAIDQDKGSYFITTESNGTQWLQLELKQESAIWKVQIRSRDYYRDRLEIKVGNQKIANDLNVTESSTTSDGENEDSSRMIKSMLEENELCGTFDGNGEEKEIYQIDCLTKDGQDISGKYVTILSINSTRAMSFSEIEVFGSGMQLKNVYFNTCNIMKVFRIIL